MEVLGWLPTLREVMSFVGCRLIDHDWKLYEVNGRAVIMCSECGKMKR